MSIKESTRHQDDRKNQEEDRDPCGERFDYLSDLEKPLDEDKVKAARRILEQLRRPYLRRPGVVGIDVGYRLLQGEDRFKDEVAIRVHVRKKLNGTILEKEKQLSFSKEKGARVAGYELGFREHSEEVDGEEKTWVTVNEIPIDVVEAQYLPSDEIRTLRPRPNNGHFFNDDQLKRLTQRSVSPLVGGLSVGNGQGPAGTLGAVVWDRTDGTPCLLSNWHVLAGSVRATVGQPCFQPAIFDGGQEASDAVATLKRWIFDQDGDAALAEILPGHDYCAGEILGLRFPVMECIEPKLGMEVRKWGRTTGFTRGFVDGIDFSGTLDYGDAGIQSFENQIHIAPRCRGTQVSAPGDSGAVWVHSSTNEHTDVEHYYAVALHFAGDVPGSASGEYAIASSIQELSKRLQFGVRPVFVPPEGYVAQGRRRTELRKLNGRTGGLIQPEGLATGDRNGGPQPTPEPITGGGG